MSVQSLSPLRISEESSASTLANLPSPDSRRRNSGDMEDADSDDEFVYPGASDTQDATSSTPADVSSQRRPSPAQLEALYAAASSGDLRLFQNLFRNSLEDGNVEPFGLANDASPRTGLTALHAAAARGYVDMVKWLIEECGAIPDLEDKEGETAVHKAALNGHLPIIKYLLPDRADVHAQDADGWTALHNACSKGYLDIVRWLCEDGGATGTIDGVPGVDARSKGGWTPLMNAASKGHLPVVQYLLTKQNADPLTRNNWGETAFDAAAAVFEVWICEVLQKHEAKEWRRTTVPYNPLSVHTTVPLILYEHQRLDVRLKTLAVSGGRPKFSASGLGRQGRRAPFELKLPVPDDETRKKTVPAWRSDVQLPAREDPWQLPKPTGKDNPSRESTEKSHFWLSDWTLDVTHPSVDAEEGWQYARSFDDPDEQWTAEPPAALERLLTGTGAMTAGLGGSGSASTSNGRSSSAVAPATHKWVRRRRWVRVMRRRLDMAPLPFLQPDGNMYHLSDDGALMPFIGEDNQDVGGIDGQELGANCPSSMLASAHDYVARARYLAGTPHPDAGGGNTALEVRRAILKLERATTELRSRYTQELERRRLAAGAQGLLISGVDETVEDDDDDDEEFHYPGASPAETVRPESVISTSTNADYFNRPASLHRVLTDLTPQLSQAPDFRVPTHEAPQKVMTPRWALRLHTKSTHSGNATSKCLNAVAAIDGFNFLTRRHCRRCGRIFCDRCSSSRALLDPSDVVYDPAFPEGGSTATSHRVCQECHDVVTAAVPSRLQGARTGSLERIFIDQDRLMVPRTRRERSSSQLSDLAECPVCNENLLDLGPAEMQEIHVKNCLEGGNGPTSQAAKYLVYKLPDESILIGTECVICLEEFVAGTMIARLSCFCSFHNTCLSSWLQRGRNCPVHAR